MDASRLGTGGRQYLDDDGHIVGINPYGGQLNGFIPSAYFSGMAPGDLDAIVAYLRTLAPLASH